LGDGRTSESTEDGREYKLAPHRDILVLREKFLDPADSALVSGIDGTTQD
jgi:hypothetical protein